MQCLIALIQTRIAILWRMFIHFSLSSFVPVRSLVLMQLVGDRDAGVVPKCKNAMD
jgi:hypothetical protein